MKKRRYTIGAAYADFCALAIVTGAIEAIFVALLHRPLSMGAAFLTFFAIVLAVILYHALISPRIHLRSPGEAMMGGKIVDARKEWTNPFGRNRTILFILLFVTLVFAGNSWDGISDEEHYLSYSLPIVLARMIALLILLSGLVSFGAGRASGGYIVALYYLMLAFSFWTTKSSILGVLPTIYGLGLLMLGMAIIAVVLAKYYGREVIPARENPPDSTCG